MADKRMYSKKITETDEFLGLPLSTQALYFHLGMSADDDGFISSPLKTMRMLGANKNELDLLLVKRYLIPFDSGVCVIKDWRINNYLRTDRYAPTLYTEEKKQLYQLENGSYELVKSTGIPMVDQWSTQYRLDKDSMLVNNKFNKYINNAGAREEEAFLTAREIFVKRYNDVAKICYGEKFVIALDEIIDTLTAAYLQAQDSELKFDKKTFDANGFNTFVSKLDDERIREIMTSTIYREDIQNRPYYILGCIFKQLGV